MTSTHEGYLPLSNLPFAAQRAHHVPELASFSLLSVPQLCDAGCDVLFTQDTATIRDRVTTAVLYTAQRDS